MLARATWRTRVIDLAIGEQALWQGVRRSYHALIHRAERTYTFGSPDCAGPWVEEIRALHRESVGRETRPESSWRLMGGWVSDGAAWCQTARRDGVLAGYAYFVAHQGWAYYHSSASRERHLTHALIWRALVSLRAAGVRYCELGWQGQATDDKGQAIEFFKRGFGGVDVPLTSELPTGREVVH